MSKIQLDEYFFEIKDIGNISNVKINNIPSNVKKYNISFFEKTYTKLKIPYESLTAYTILPNEHYHSEKEKLNLLKKYNIVPVIINYDDEKLKLFLSDCGDILNKDNIPSDWKNQMINILNILKSENIFHNDMHPDNFAVKNNKIYLIDFGCSTFDKPRFPGFNCTISMVHKSKTLLELFEKILDTTNDIHMRHFAEFSAWINKDCRKNLRMFN